MSRLARQTVLGFAQLLVAMCAALFIAAGTLDYWEARLYLVVFFGCAAVITLHLWQTDRRLLQGRVSAGPAAETQPFQKMIQAIAAVVFIAFLVVPALDHRFGWSRIPVALELAGDLLVVLGFIVVFLVFNENSYAAATVGIGSDQHVIATGPYAIVRHPMYAGALVLLLGTSLALGSWWGLLLLIPMTFVLVLRLRAEERLLATELPGYAEYCNRVRYRLVPQVW